MILRLFGRCLKGGTMHRRSLTIGRFLSLLLAVASSLALHAGSGAAPFVTVALSGQAAPYPTPGAFRFFHPPAINNNGVVTFFGAVNQPVDPFRPYSQGIWTGTPGNLALLALEGQPAPGASGPFDGIQSFPAISD